MARTRRYRKKVHRRGVRPVRRRRQQRGGFLPFAIPAILGAVGKAAAVAGASAVAGKIANKIVGRK